MESISVPIDWVPWCINTGKSLIPLTLRFLAQKRNLLIPLELSRVMHQGSAEATSDFPEPVGVFRMTLCPSKSARIASS